MSQALDTRTRLLEATIDAINNGGEASVRVHSVAEIAEVREPSVYHFFKNRKELVEAAQAERYRRGYLEMFSPFKAVVALAETKEDFIVAIRQLFTGIYRPERHEARATRVNVIGSAQKSESLKKSVNEANLQIATTFSDLLADCQKKGWIREDLDPMMLALWVMGQINSRNLAEMNESQYDLDAWNKIAIESVLFVFEPKQ
jgi:AcrR family transcriptional regulator